MSSTKFGRGLGRNVKAWMLLPMLSFTDFLMYRIQSRIIDFSTMMDFQKVGSSMNYSLSLIDQSSTVITFNVQWQNVLQVKPQNWLKNFCSNTWMQNFQTQKPRTRIYAHLHWLLVTFCCKADVNVALKKNIM